MKIEGLPGSRVSPRRRGLSVLNVAELRSILRYHYGVYRHLFGIATNCEFESFSQQRLEYAPELIQVDRIGRLGLQVKPIRVVQSGPPESCGYFE